jgi:hypothetical protein
VASVHRNLCTILTINKLQETEAAPLLFWYMKRRFVTINQIGRTGGFSSVTSSCCLGSIQRILCIKSSFY